MDRRLSAALRVGFAALTLVAIAAQLAVLAGADSLNLVNFLSYFTIQSNLIGVTALLATAVAGRNRGRAVDWLRGAASVYLTVTFVVVILLLSNVDVGLQLGWVDIVLHKLFPVVVVADFLLDPPRVRLSPRDAALWLVFPLLWLAYTMIRGPMAGWYPYPFLDPDLNGGYGAVAVMIVAVLVGGAVLCWIYAALGNRLAGMRREAAALA